MKIFIDIGHPAHVHYFKNLINILSEKGHTFIVTARDKEMTHYLLDKYGIKYTSRGKGSKSILGKAAYMLKADLKLLRLAKGENPDLFLSFGSPYCAQVSSLLGKEHIAIDDTESATLGQFFYRPFSNCILTPDSFKKDLGSKHIRFPSYMDLSYLHPNVFQSDKMVLDLLNIKKDEPYVILRFVGWEAAHDIGQAGIRVENKIKAVKAFEKYAKVFISSESELPEGLSKYKLQLPPEQIHHALAFASLFYGESGTMTTESAVLGTPAIFLNNNELGCIDEQEERYGLVYKFTESEQDQQLSIKKGTEILKNGNFYWKNKRDRLLDEKINLSSFLVWFIENYPESKKNGIDWEHFLQAKI